MGANTKIEWCDFTFNCWRGCTKVSPGCAHCYAETLSGRNPKTLGMWGPKGTRVVAAEAQWKLPVKWNDAAACTCTKCGKFDSRAFAPMTGHWQDCPQNNRPRVFCASLADVFEDWQGPMVNAAGDELFNDRAGGWSDRCGDKDGHRLRLTMQDVRNRLFRLIDATPNLTWLVLSKRPENIARMTPPKPPYSDTIGFPSADKANPPGPAYFRPNLWLGTSVENQHAADERIPHLLKLPAAVRFLSCEPLLGPVDLSGYFGGAYVALPGDRVEPNYNFGVDWVIVGGESGGARPCNVEWIRSIVKQCRAAGVPCFVKQLGAEPRERCDQHACMKWPGWDSGKRFQKGTVMPEINGIPVLLNDKKGGDPSEWPADLRVREFPIAK